MIANTSIGDAILFSCNPYVGIHYRSSQITASLWVLKSQAHMGSPYTQVYTVPLNLYGTPALVAKALYKQVVKRFHRNQDNVGWQW